MIKILDSGGINYNKNNIDIHWELTHNCNFNCEYCFRKDKISENYLSLLDANNIIDTLNTLPFNIEITLTGGEPTIYPYISYIIDRLLICNNIIRINIFTNGSNNLIKSLKYNQKLKVYLSYHPTFAIDDIFIDNLIHIVDKKINFEVSLMLEKNNFEKINNIYNKIKDFKYIYAIPLEPIEKQNYNANYIMFEKIVNNKFDDNYNKQKVIYYIINKDEEIIKEEYSFCEIRKLPNFYHSFKLMECECGTFLVINPDGTARLRCDIKNKNCYPINNIDKLIKSTKICFNNYCTNRDDIRLIHKNIAGRMNNEICSDRL